MLGEALHIDYEQFNRAYILSLEDLWLEDDGYITEGKIKRKERIGLDAADIDEKDSAALKRYILE